MQSAPTSPRDGEPPAASEGEARAAEIRAVDAQVWDFTKHLVHPTAAYVILQAALWVALEDNAAFRAPRCGFLAESAVHLVQFLGAWSVLYGTLLRDMGRRTRAATLLLWFAAAGALGAWLYPDRRDPASADGLKLLLGTQLLAAVVSFGITMRTWRREKAAHERAAAAQSAAPGVPSS
jgi:hypothetical protein